jgi:hypothetical protein
MILGHLALVAAALFASAAFYVNFAEQPARLSLDDRAALLQWQRSYARAALMQASLAMVGFFLGLAAWWWQGRDAIWLAGALAILAPWPWTLLVIKPVNDRLKVTTPEHAGAESRALIERWGLLHAAGRRSACWRRRSSSGRRGRPANAARHDSDKTPGQDCAKMAAARYFA